MESQNDGELVKNDTAPDTTDAKIPSLDTKDDLFNPSALTVPQAAGQLSVCSDTAQFDKLMDCDTSCSDKPEPPSEFKPKDNSPAECTVHPKHSLDSNTKEIDPCPNAVDVTDVQSVVKASLGLSLISQFESTEESDSESSSDSSDDSVSDTELVWKEERSVTYPKVKGEVDYRDLPSEEKCDIPFPPNGKILPIGEVAHYTEKLIVIKSFPNTPAVNDGTVLWRKDKTSIARIFEIFGPVKTPFYSILVPSQAYADELGLETGDTVYVVPGDTSVTTYVFTNKLLEEKGCDASWKNDIEIPEEYQEFSDDEKESLKKQKKNKKQGPKTDSKTGNSSRQYTGTQPVSNHFSGTPRPNVIQSSHIHQPLYVGTHSVPPRHMLPYTLPGVYPYTPHPFSMPREQMYPYPPPPPPPPGYYPRPRYPPP